MEVDNSNAGTLPSNKSISSEILPDIKLLFNPALLIVDLQNDFCPSDGTLAVGGGKEIVRLVNSLLSLPGFVVRIATQDFHPPDHVSFATNHPPPNNIPFESTVPLKNWQNGRQEEVISLRLWPVHCVQNTRGADLIDELHQSNVDIVVRKGMDSKSEMYSVFADAFGNFDCDQNHVTHNVRKLLRERNITHVYVVGLAGDYCVKHTALDAARSGFTTYVVQEGTRCVDSHDGWSRTVRDFQEAGVVVASAEGPELDRVRSIQ